MVKKSKGINLKKETRGRKPTGRVRNKILSAKFTKAERDRINDGAKELKLKQHEFIISATELYRSNERNKRKPKKENGNGRRK